MMKEIDISTRECSHIVADIALPVDIYYNFKHDMLEKDFNNEFRMNFWDNYEGFDRNRDGYGDNTYRVYQYADKLWTYNPSVKFFYGSPVLTLLNFLSKLAPFSEPIFLLEDKQPKFMN